MTEDDNLLYDIEGNWQQLNGGRKVFFRHKERFSLFRIVDLDKETITFSDICRVSKITDINKVLVKKSNPEELKDKWQSIIVRVLDDIKPISMPYKPESIHAFVEAFPSKHSNGEDDIIGILYFWDTPDEKKSREEGILEAEMIPCRRFFKTLQRRTGAERVLFEEIDFKEYNKLKEDRMGREINEQDNTKRDSVCADKGKGEEGTCG